MIWPSLKSAVTGCDFIACGGLLPEPARQDLARSLHLLKVKPGTLIYREGQPSLGLYLLKWGAVEVNRLSPIGQSLIRQRSAGELFGYVSLLANPDSARHQTQAIALTASEIWFLPQPQFRQLMQQYAELEHLFNALLAQDLNAFSIRIAQEQRRIQGLRDYIHAVPTGETILGSSKFSQKLKKVITQATATLQPVVLQGSSGTGKTFLAGLIHSRSGLVDQPFAELDCAQLPRTKDGGLNTDRLFGRVGGVPGLIELLERGTLLLSNLQVLSQEDRDRLAHYCNSRNILLNALSKATSSDPPKTVQSWVRLILASPEKLVLPGVKAIAIKLFSLPQRKADIPDFAHDFLTQFCQAQNRPPLTLDQSELRRLISYDYPGNLTELAEILHRAVIMTPPGQTVIPEQALWSVESAKNAFRVDLLTQIPWLRQVFAQPLVPRRAVDRDDGSFCARHPGRVPRAANPREQHHAKFLLGLVVAGLSAALCFYWSALVCHLPIYDHSRMAAPVFPMAISASAAALANTVAQSLGSVDSLRRLCSNLPLGKALGFTPPRLSLGLAAASHYGGGCNL